MRCNLFIHVISLCAVLLVPATAGGAETQSPFWSALTPFEIRTLRQIELARTGDADTLLALALMASGDIRDRKGFARIKKRVRRFVQTRRPDILAENTVYRRGEKLLHAMHTGFFAGGERDTELVKGYDAEQSRVSTIFQNGRFNCISSAILYMVLARYFDMNVEGVVTAHHAFIQIKDENGGFIEVETTSNTGYGLHHDEAFYRTRFTRFSMARDLPVPTYADYLERRVLAPYQLITENMNYQHTAKKRMKAPDRRRLHELIGYLDSETPMSQLIRLNALHNAGVELIAQDARAGTERMLSVLAPVLRHVKTRIWIQHRQQPEVAGIWQRIGAIHLIMGHLHMKEDRFQAARHQYDLASKWAREQKLRTQADIGLLKTKGFEAFEKQQWQPAIETLKKLMPLFDAGDDRQKNAARENIAAAYWNWAAAAGSKENWAAAADRYAAVITWSRDPKNVAQAGSAHAHAAAMHHMQRKEWETAIEKFKKTLPHQDETGRQAVRANIGSAYINWGNALFDQQAYTAAVDKYEAALGVLKGEGRSLAIRNIAAAYHNLVVPHLNARQPEKAVTILKSALNRFPDCTPCREELRDIKQRIKPPAAGTD